MIATLAALLVPLAAQAGAPSALLESRAGALTEVPLTELQSDTLRELDAVSVRFAEPRIAARPEPGRVEIAFANGDLLRGEVVGGEGEVLLVRAAGTVQIAVPIERMARLVFPARLPLEGDSALAPAPQGDRLYRLAGDGLDRIDGAVSSFGAEGVVYESLLGRRTFPWSEVGALLLESLGSDDERSGAGARVACDLVDGGRLRGSLVSLDRRGCRIGAGDGSELFLPVEVLAEVALDDGSIAFLSDLAPVAAAEGSPFGDDLGMSWPHRMDRAVDGRPLTAGGRAFSRGIGVHAPSRLTFDLGGAWDELRGQVAIDDQVLTLPARGSVVFRVTLDGEVAWQSGVVRGGTPPVALPPIDLHGRRELVLECEMAADLHVADRADWLRMLLVKREP